MAVYLFADRVQVTATASGTGPFALGAAVAGYQTFAFLTTTGNLTYYTASDQSGNWEVGIGTYDTTGPTLSRAPFSSSSGGSAVTFVGTINVYCTYPAERAVLTDFAQTLSNKRINPRVNSAVSTVTPNADTDDQFNATALLPSAVIANPTGSPVDGQRLTIRLASAGAPVTLTWGNKYYFRGLLMPTTLTSFSYIGCIYNYIGIGTSLSPNSTWDVIALTGPG